jgi:hypothetical protein
MYICEIWHMIEKAEVMLNTSRRNILIKTLSKRFGGSKPTEKRGNYINP